MEPGLLIFVTLLGICCTGLLLWYVVLPIAESLRWMDFGSLGPVGEYDYDESPRAAGSLNDTRTTTPVPLPYQYITDTDAVRGDTAARTTPDEAAEPVRLPDGKISDAEIIVWLSNLKNADGKHRFSANAIAQMIGGTRSQVLEQVKAARNAPHFVYANPIRVSSPDGGYELERS